MSERFRSLWVHSQFCSAEEVCLGRPTVRRTCARNPTRIYMIIVEPGGSHANHHSVNRPPRGVEMFETWANYDKV